jgi:hypothetical protein
MKLAGKIRNKPTSAKITARERGGVVGEDCDDPRSYGKTKREIGE